MKEKNKRTGNSSGITPRSYVCRRKVVFGEEGHSVSAADRGRSRTSWVFDLLREATCKGHVVTTLSDKYFRSTVFALFAG